MVTPGAGTESTASDAAGVTSSSSRSHSIAADRGWPRANSGRTHADPGPILAPSGLPPVGVDPELGVPVYVTVDRTLRVKVTDACGMACVFCHNEGTPVVIDNRGAMPGDYAGVGRSGRVSIYVGSNGARFLPDMVVPNEEFASVLSTLRASVGVAELHLTGGEPTLHPQLHEVIRLARSTGYEVRMTSNGENGSRMLPACAAAGLERVNFSVFGTTADELARVQHPKVAGRHRVERRISALRRSVRTALDLGLKVSANIVVPDVDHAPRVRRLLTEYAEEVTVRLLPSLDAGRSSIIAIESILTDLGAVPTALHFTAGASDYSTSYRLLSGQIVCFKRIRPVRLPRTCTGCRFNNDTDCQEGFYGLRLYRDRAGGYQVGVCIQRMDLCLPLQQFLASELGKEIVGLRDADRRELCSAYQ